MFNIKQIIEGWRNDLIPPENLKDIIKQVSEERLEICNACPYNSTLAKENGYKTIRLDYHCTSCGCPLRSKTKSLSSSCPLSKWEAFISDEDLKKLQDESNTKSDNKGT